MPNLVRQQLIFSGTVQNVGFRVEMIHLAQHVGLSGWVMNCEDGSVKAQVQGAPTAIRAVVEALRLIRHIHITEIKVTPLDVIEGETGFSIRYY